MQQQKVVTKISKFIEFTPEQKERAATVDLEEFLLRQGEKFIKSGREKRLASDHSVTVRGCEWFDHASNEGGRAVSFVQKYYGKSYVEAMSMLLGESMEPFYPQAKKREQVDQKPFAPPVPNANMHRVFAYLLKTRGLDADVVSYFARRKLLYEDAKYHNCIFLGYDGNMPKYGAVRSTNSDFKRDLTGSDKRFSFFISAESKTQTVHLFESAIDLLSYVTLELRHGQSRHDDLLSLAGVYKTENKQDIPLALKTYLDRHKETKVIYLHLDNDEVGRTATRQITNALSAEYTVIDQPPQSGKDFNDFLKNEIQKKRKEQVR